MIGRRLGFLAKQLAGDYLFGKKVSAADPYLYVMLRWAGMQKLAIPEPLSAFVGADGGEARGAPRAPA